MHVLATLNLVGLISGLSACATVARISKDVSTIGHGITHIADEVRGGVFSQRSLRTQHIIYRVPGQPVVHVKNRASRIQSWRAVKAYQPVRLSGIIANLV